MHLASKKNVFIGISALIGACLIVAIVIYFRNQGTTVAPSTNEAGAPGIEELVTEKEDDENGRQSEPFIQFGSERIMLEYARTFEEKARGLSLRESLPQNRGMLFVFHEPAQWAIWMKDMQFSIDIVWISDKGRVVHIEERVSPDTFPTAFIPPENALYVLEVGAGVVEAAGVKVQDQLIIPLSAAELDQNE